jgi:hypothetical protein
MTEAAASTTLPTSLAYRRNDRWKCPCDGAAVTAGPLGAAFSDDAVEEGTGASTARYARCSHFGSASRRYSAATVARAAET